ncbi:MAG: DUF3566 domain-containing protein [Ilumatobacter sp.]|uniref:DUF3566 domain-containing protein n=1 Tax=Ilumatobacter sp. TaxID=1967498 RepID=UPI0032972AF0
MSKTERDLSADSDLDALGELFTDEEFDAAFDQAIEHADLDLEIADLEAGDEDDADPTDARDRTPVDDPDLDDTDLDDTDLDATDLDDTDLDDTDLDAADLDDHTVIVVHTGDDLDDDDASYIEAAEADTDEATATDTDVDESEPVDLLDDDDDDDDDEAGAEADVLPQIVPATEDPASEAAQPEALTRVGDVDLAPDTEVDEESRDVSDDILEELRRADIDGPFVPHAPQDDTTAAVRRPRRAADYDPAPVPIPAKVPRVLGRKPRVRKVTRVVRHVDPWSVFKIAIVAHMVLYVIVLTASVLLWNVANATGTVDNVERFFESFGWNTFEFNGGELYHAGWIAGLFVVIGLTGLAVLAATLFNLITDLVGGVRFTVLEEEVVETRTSPMRRFVVRRPEPEIPALLHDSSGPMYREAVVDDSGANLRPTR